MAALRTSVWVEDISGTEPPHTPARQILSSDVDQDESEFSGFSRPAESPSRDEEGDDVHDVDGDPFETSSQAKFSSPSATRDVDGDTFKISSQKNFSTSSATRDVPHTVSLVAGTGVLTKRRGRQLSPCAYRSRSQADLLFNALQHEITTDRQPHRRASLDSEASSEHILHIPKPAHDGGAKTEFASAFETSEVPSFSIEKLDCTNK